ncbi:MAG: DUF2079 domain-containing protein [Myxococcota bacterium]|nr:DUF2079 domain-containing protein [Myxococcota bacterium]
MIVSIVVLLFAAMAFWGTATSTAWARIAALETIEPYGFAVHEQLLFNFSQNGSFFQTIHMGYDNAWTWSGHRGATLPINGLLYGFSPNALWLSRLQITEVLLGVIPAAIIGRRAFGNDWGVAVGGLVYLSAPPTIALALQDYQDLVLAAPALLLAMTAFSARRLHWVLAGALIGCLPREECISLMVVCAALATPPPNRSRRVNIGIAAAVAVVYAGFLTLCFPLTSSSHDMPLQNAVMGLLHWPPRIFLDGFPYLTRFYALLWAPIGFLCLAAPLWAAPGAALVLLHMTVPWGHGVDRDWGAHVHHMAPILPFFVAATIHGLARVLRFIRTTKLNSLSRSSRKGLSVAVCMGLFSYAALWDRDWAAHYRLIPSLSSLAPDYTHPAWILARQLDLKDVPIVSKKLSLAVSARERSYTWDDSLHEKAPGEGLSVGTHLIVDQRNKPVVSWAMQMKAAQVVATEGPFLLITWENGAPDLNVPANPYGDLQDLSPWPGQPTHREAIAGVPPRQAPPPPPVPQWQTGAHDGPGEKPLGGPAQLSPEGPTPRTGAP